MNVCELRLVSTDISVKAVKVLREYFPNVPISKMKQKIEGGEPIFSCSSGSCDGKN